MSNATKLLCLAVFTCCAFTASAATIPPDALGAQKFDAMRCVAETTQNCINTICLNSTQRNCQGECAKMSQQKCQQQSNQ